MQQTIIRASYEVAKMTIPAGAGADMIEKLFEFQLPDGSRVHSVTQIKESAIIGSPNTFLILVERANQFIIDTPETPHLSS